tara:strand:+ start:1578 stop:2453 length:876 start_codon:yes stop_codon:yes gene_type:complete
VTGLKSIIEAHWAELTSNQQRVGAFVLSNPFLVATMGIEDLAEAAGVSPPTITRFVRQLGLKNYAEFRAIAVRRYQDLLRPIENVSRAQDASSADVVGSSLAAARANLDGLGAVPVSACEALVDRMVAAGRVGLLGFGSSARALTYLHGLTEPFLSSLHLLDGAAGHERMARLIGRMGPRDLIIAMTLPRYSVATMEFVRLARASGVPTVGITDSAQSPLAALCDDTVLMPAAHPVLNSSALASLAFFEAVAALLTARYQSTSDATAVTRLIFPYLYTDEASSGTAPKDQE